MTTATEQQPLTTNRPLHDKVALVTGGTRGIGGAISHRLAEEGAHVAAGYWRHHEPAEKFMAEMSALYPGTITVHHGNIGDAEDCRRVVREVIEQHGRLDIVRPLSDERHVDRHGNRGRLTRPSDALL